MDQGCPHEGTDHRLLGRWGCWVQTRLSFHSRRPPVQLLFRFPPYVSLLVPLRADPPRFLSVRAGFRWDPHWGVGGYIFPEAIVKVFDHEVL